MPNLTRDFAHLGPGGGAVVLPPFTGMDWYEAYGARFDADGADGRLVICTEGALALLQEQADGSTERVTLGPGDYAINPAGVWHTADVAPGESATCIFITSGLGTEHRSR